MNQITKTINEFQVIGITCRTSNRDEMSSSAKIPELWRRLYEEDILNKIPNKLDSTIIAVYHSYESNKNSMYSLTIGSRVESGTRPPSGMDGLSVPTQTYWQFTSQKGSMPQVVIETWQQIWILEDQALIHRQYTYDFEIYDQRAMDPSSSQVDIFIGLKADSL